MLKLDIKKIYDLRIKKFFKAKKILFYTLILLVFLFTVILIIRNQKIKSNGGNKRNEETVLGEQSVIQSISQNETSEPILTESTPSIISPSPPSLQIQSPFSSPTSTQIPTPTTPPSWDSKTKVFDPDYHLFLPGDSSELVEYEGAALSIEKGRLKFRIVADWGSEDDEETLFIGNFNGQNQKDALIIVGSKNQISADFYNSEGNHIANDSNAYFEDNLYGKEIDFEYIWDFTQTPWVINIYINNELNNTIYPEDKPQNNNLKVLINNKIDDFEIISD